MRSTIIEKLELFCRGSALAVTSVAVSIELRKGILIGLLLALQLISSMPTAEAKHNRFIGTPRSSVSQSDSEASVTQSDPESSVDFANEPEESAPESEPVSIDQPESVDFTSKTANEETSTSSDVAPISETDSASSIQSDSHNDSADSIVADSHEESAQSTSKVAQQTVDRDSAAAAIDVSLTAAEPLAVTWYREKAEQGNVDAQFNLAMINETGFGIKKDERTAVKWYAKAADKGHPEAQLKLGMLYLLGLGAAESRIKGGKWVRSSARQDNRFARVLSEKFLSKNIEGLDVASTLTEVRKTYNSKDPKQAEEKLLTLIARAEIKSKNKPTKERFAGGITGSGAKAGSVGNRVPDFLAESKVQKTVVGNSLSRIRRHAKDGVAEAQYEWGVILEKGNQVPIDKEQAVKWFQAAAEQNHPGGQFKLAIANMYGIGVPLDFDSGKELLARAARQNHPVANKLLKYVGRTPTIKGVKQINSVSVAWHLEKAIENKDGNAMLSLGYMFQNGWGVMRDRDEGILWLNKAKQAGGNAAARQLRVDKVNELNIDSTTNQTRNVFSRAMDQETTAAIVANSVSSEEFQQNRDLPTAAADNKKIARAISRVINNVKKRANDLLSQDAGKQKPLMLIVGGLVLGFMVFRIMRRPSTRHSQSAYRY